MNDYKAQEVEHINRSPIAVKVGLSGVQDYNRCRGPTVIYHT